MTSRCLEQQIARASQALIGRGGQFVDLPTLVPAALVLELAGEGLRPRVFFTTAPDGVELCLRPDLTIPAALQYVAQAEYDDDPFAWACKGPVFRAPRPGDNRPPEFVQIGLERFGDKQVVAADVGMFLSAWDACIASRLGPQAADQSPLQVRLCDGGLLPKILENCEIPEVWRTALQDQVNHPRAFLTVLARASGQAAMRPPSALEQAFATLTPAQAKAKVQQLIDQDQLTLPAVRCASDIAQRLVARARTAVAAPLEPQIGQTLQALALFTQTSTHRETLDDVVAMAAKIGVDLSNWRHDWRARFDAIEQEAPEALALCRFEALGEESFDYYDGMAFDIADNAAFSNPMATGGRYDRLVSDLSNGARHARAIGCVIRPDRFATDFHGESQ